MFFGGAPIWGQKENLRAPPRLAISSGLRNISLRLALYDFRDYVFMQDFKMPDFRQCIIVGVLVT